mgnify:FL=1
MAHVTSEDRVAKEIMARTENDEGQECKRRNGLTRDYVPIEQVPDRNQHWFRHDHQGNILHCLVNPM